MPIEQPAGEVMGHLRYVVLRHDGVPEPHFDLMVEAAPGSKLVTWRSPQWPVCGEANLTRLGEHRRDYLEYEGPVSNDRGTVRRVAGGTCSMDWQTAHDCWLRLPEVTLHIQRLDDDHWLATPRA